MLLTRAELLFVKVGLYAAGTWMRWAVVMEMVIAAVSVWQCMVLLLLWLLV